jgi:hypothetical protein
MDIQNYKATLAHVISQMEGLTPAEIMQHPAWESLTPLITQAVLDDAYQYKQVLSLASFDKVCSRRVKSLSRIQEKRKKSTAFKVNSDFVAFTINTEQDISNFVTQLSQQFPFFFERNKITGTDIVTYCFAYDGHYLMEFQIGHPFASYVFCRDSYNRDSTQHKYVDLWDEGFYEHVRNVILGKERSNIELRLSRLYGETLVEPELKQILDAVEKTQASN